MAGSSAHDSRLLSAARFALWGQSPLVGYTFGLTAFALAFVVRWQLAEELPSGFPFTTFLLAIVATAFVAGRWPAALVAVLSALAARYAFIAPVHALTLTPEIALALGLFLANAALIIVVIDVMRSALACLQSERAKSARLAEQRSLLLMELQHRISNNLQVVSALMNLQRSALSDAQARQALSEASQRLSLIAKLNRKLHDPANAGLDLKAFLRELCHDVSQAAGIADPGCHVKGPDGVALPADKAVPLALIVTELLNNSIEHGFAGRDSGDLRMALERSGDKTIVLTVQDDGHGLPAGFDPRQVKSLGLRIVQALAQQIGAQLEMVSDNGTTCRLTFAP